MKLRRENNYKPRYSCSESEITERMEQRAAERRKIKEEWLAKVEEAASLERAYKQLMCDALRNISAMLSESMERDHQFFEMFGASIHPTKRRRNNEEDEENEEEESQE